MSAPIPDGIPAPPDELLQGLTPSLMVPLVNALMAVWRAGWGAGYLQGLDDADTLITATMKRCKP